MHYYQFNIGDYASHTSRLSPMEDLAYRRLLDLYYLNERPFNGCSTDVARDIGLQEYQNEVDYILSKFFEKDGDNWVNKRVDKEVKAYRDKLKTASKAGKASAKARKNKASEQALSDRSTTVQPTNNHKPITNNHKPTITNSDKPKKSKCKVPDGFLLTSERSSKAIDYWGKKNRADLITQVEDIFDQFINHHRAKGSTMACWESAWKTWYTNAIKFNRSFSNDNSQGRPVTKQQQNRDEVERQLSDPNYALQNFY